MALNTVSSDRLSTNVKNTNFTAAEKQDLTDDILPLAGQLGNKNKIINGGMQIFQRSASIADIGGSNGYFAADRYRFSQSGAARFTISQSTDTPNGFGSSMKVDVTTANASPSAGQYVFFQHRIEGQNVQDFAKGSSDAKQYALSFHVKSPKTGTHIIQLEDVQNTRSCSKSYTVNSANTWEKKTIIFPADTTGAITNDNANRFQLYIWLMAGTTYSSGTLATTWASTVEANRAAGQVNLIDNTSNDFFITGIQLEVGSVATDFEHRSFGQELALCQRYYYKHTEGNGKDIGVGTYYRATLFAFSLKFPVSMRTAPSLDYVSGTDYYTIYHSDTFDAFTSMALERQNENSAAVDTSTGTSGVQGAGGILATNNSASYFAFSAEL